MPSGRRHVEGMRQDPPDDPADRRRQAELVEARHRHQQRHDREQEQVVEDEDQDDRGAGRGADRREDQRRPHIADVGIGPGDALHHRLRPCPGCSASRCEGEREGAEGREGRGGDEGPVRQLIQGLVGDEPVEQARQRHVDQEELHPGEPGLGLLHHLAAEEAEPDQAEEGGEQVEQPDQIGHRRLQMEGIGRPETTVSSGKVPTLRQSHLSEGQLVPERRARTREPTPALLIVRDADLEIPARISI